MQFRKTSSLGKIGGWKWSRNWLFSRRFSLDIKHNWVPEWGRASQTTDISIFEKSNRIANIFPSNFQGLVLRAQTEFEFNSFSTIIFYRQSFFRIGLPIGYSTDLEHKIDDEHRKNIGKATIADIFSHNSWYFSIQLWRTRSPSSVGVWI